MDNQNYSYEDLQKLDVIDILKEEEKEEEVKEEVKETEVTEQIKETPKEEEIEEIDPKDLVEQAAKKAVEEYVEANKPEDEKLSEQEEYQRWADKFKEEKGKEPTWTEVALHLEETTLEKIEKRQEEKQRLETERLNEIKRIEEEQVKKFNDTIDLQLNELYEDGKLTPIKDEKNPSDQGVVERMALFKAMQETNNKRISEGKPPVYSIKEIYAFHYTKPTVQPAGADAPVSMGKGSTPPDDNEEMDYRELKRPWSFFGKR